MGARLRVSVVLLALALAACAETAPSGPGGTTDRAPTQSARHTMEFLPNPLGSCAGHCGGNAGNCWCDSFCVTYGDCCPDKPAHCEAPPGDLCGDAIPIPTVPFHAEAGAADTSNAQDLMHYAEGGCAGEAGGWGEGAPEQVYAFTAPVDGVYAVTLTPEADFDSNLYVLSGCQQGEVATCIAGDEQVGQGVRERVEFSLEEGETAHIVVDGWGAGASGRYALSVDYAQGQCDVPFDHRLDEPRAPIGAAPLRPHGDYVFRLAVHHSCLDCDLVVDDDTMRTVRAHADAMWIAADVIGAMRSVADEEQNLVLTELADDPDWPIYTAANVSTLGWRAFSHVGEDLHRVNDFDYQRTTTTDVHPSQWAMEVAPSEDLPGNLVIDDALLGFDPLTRMFDAHRNELYRYPMEFQRAEDVFDVEHADFPRYQLSATCKHRAARSAYRPALPERNIRLADVPRADGLRANALARIWALYGEAACDLIPVQCDDSRTLDGATLDGTLWSANYVPSHVEFGRSGFVRHCVRPDDAGDDLLAARCFGGPCADDERGWDLYGGDTLPDGHWAGDGVLDVEVHPCATPGTEPHVRRFRAEFPNWEQPGDGFGRLGVQDIACMLPDPSKPATPSVIAGSIADHVAVTGASGVASDNMSYLSFGDPGNAHASVPWRHPDGDRLVHVVGQGYNKTTQLHRPAYPERDIGRAEAQQRFVVDWATMWLRTRAQIHCHPDLQDFTWLPNTNPILPVVQATRQTQSFEDELKMSLDILGGGMWDEKWGNVDFGSDLLRRRALLKFAAAHRISSLGRPALLSLQFQGFNDFDPDPDVTYSPTPLSQNSLGERFSPEPAGIDNRYAFTRGLATYLLVQNGPSLLLDPYRWYGEPTQAIDGTGTFDRFATVLAGSTWMRHFLDRDVGAPLMSAAGATEPVQHRHTAQDASVLYRHYERALALQHTRGPAIGGEPLAVQAPEGQDWFLDVVMPWGGWHLTHDRFTPSPLACDVSDEFSVPELIQCRKLNRRSIEGHSNWSGCELDHCYDLGDTCRQERSGPISACHVNARTACERVCVPPGDDTETIVRRIHIPGGTWLVLHPNRSLLLWADGAQRDTGREVMRELDIENCDLAPTDPAYPGGDVCTQLLWVEPPVAARVNLPILEPGDCESTVRDFRCPPSDVE